MCSSFFQNKREILRRLNQNLKAQEDEKGKNESKNTSESAGSEDGREQGDQPLLGDRKKWEPGAPELVVPLAQLSLEDSLSGTECKYFSYFFVTMVLVNQFAMCNVFL